MPDETCIVTRSFKLRGAESLNDAGEFVGWASVYSTRDAYDDEVAPGCFAKSLADSATRPLLWSHDPRESIGLVELEETPRGLKMRGKLDMAVARAREIHSLMRNGVVRGASIGFVPVRYEPLKGGGMRFLEAKLLEVSLTVLPANELAQVTAVKSVSKETKDMENVKAVDDKVEGIAEELRGEIAGLKREIAALDMRSRNAGGAWSSDGGDFGSRMVRAIEEHRAAFSSAGRVRFSLPGPLEVRAVQRPTTLPSSTSSRIGEASTPPVSDLISLIPRAEINAPLVYIPRETNPSWTAAPQTEGAVKAVSTVELQGVQIPVVTIATTLTASRQLLEDLAGVEAFIRSRLEYAILRTLESEILLGSGGSDHLTGLIMAASNWSLPSPLSGNLWDLLRMAAAEVENRGFRPTVAVMNPQTALRVQLQKDAELRYLAAPNGIPPIVTSAEMSSNAVLIADLSQVILRIKSDMVTDLSESHADNFVRNLVTFRTELRAALAIYSPSAMVKFTLPS
jgi:HK97 family phage prohead protease